MKNEIYKSVDAELSLKITPVVSGDNQITMDIEVNQSDFTARISQYAPPGKMSRKFKSLVRVKDQEIILLGGLEEKQKRDTASGVPFLSRIPVLKWIFSSRSKVNQKTRLNVLIKPTIIS
jgi:type IV pilus assembly protein PilQ